MLTQRPVGTDDVGKHIGLQEVLGYVELWPKHILLTFGNISAYLM